MSSEGPTLEIADQVRLICSSYQNLLGCELFAGWRELSECELSEAIFEAPYVVVSHGIEDVPVFNFGNRVALWLWGLNFEEFTKLPSHRSAQESERAEREKLLADVARQGYSNHYEGMRVSASGRRFRIEAATVFNLVDDRGRHRGQAATFPRWTFL